MMLWIPALGGLLSGFLVFRFAPEAEGHGTDAMIDSFHRKKGIVRKQVPVIKTIASAITIGSGGSAGKEGPIAQIGSGFGSILASLLKLSDTERDLVGIISMTDLRTAMADAFLHPLLIARDIAVTGVMAVTMEDTLNAALKVMAAVNVRELPVVSKEDSRKILTMVSRKDITRAYHEEMERNKSRKTGAKS